MAEFMYNGGAFFVVVGLSLIPAAMLGIWALRN